MRTLELISDHPTVSELADRYNRARDAEDSGTKFQELVDEIDSMIDHADWELYLDELQLILGLCQMSLGELAITSARPTRPWVRTCSRPPLAYSTDWSKS